MLAFLRLIFVYISLLFIFIYLFILGFYVTFNTVQVISRGEVGRGRGNQYIQLFKVLYCKLPSNGKQLPAFPLEVGPGTEPRSQRWKARVLPLCHHCPHIPFKPSVHESKNILTNIYHSMLSFDSGLLNDLPPNIYSASSLTISGADLSVFCLRTVMYCGVAW